MNVRSFKNYKILKAKFEHVCIGKVYIYIN